ncbi:MAG: glycosyltransferase family 4 protein [Acidimicrobiales bacterium]|nr:glycosyltransferase family 4 protein [Acidimicrobiales bacterium]
MNIVVLCPHFEPDLAPTGEVMTRIADELVARGHRLEVVTSLPWYQHHAIEPGWEGRAVRVERRSWGRITRVHPFPTDRRNVAARALAFGGFTALASLVGLGARRPDAVLAMAPPLTLGPAGWLVARARRVPFVFNIQDVFPDVAIELGLLQGARAIRAAYWLERVTYRRSDAVTVLSDDLAENVRSKITRGPGGRRDPDQAAKVRVIPNFVDTDWIRPGPRDNAYRREHDLRDGPVVMYAGNVGFSQSLDLVVETARRFREERPDVRFVINGGGAQRAELMARAEGLDNLRFVDMQPKGRLPEVLAAGDVHLVPLKRGLARSSVPSKLYSILAAGRPVLASVDEGTEVQRTVERAGAGVAVGPEDQPAFERALGALLDDPDGRDRMGASGRSFVEGWASPAAVAASYEALFVELVEAAGRVGGRRRAR